MKAQESWVGKLYTPTQISKIGNNYYIVDCWHHRIIYNDNLSEPIESWKTLSDNFKGGHSIAYSNHYFLADNTDAEKIDVYRISRIPLFSKLIKQIDIFPQICGNVSWFDQSRKVLRPHFMIYDEKNQQFLCALSWGGGIAFLEDRSDDVCISNVVLHDKLERQYIKSLSIIHDVLYCALGGGRIETFDVFAGNIIHRQSYTLDTITSDVNFVTFINGYFYLTFWNDPYFIRCKNIEDIQLGNYTRLYEQFHFKGIPYYISSFDGKYYITEIDKWNAIKECECIDDCLVYKRDIYSFGEADSDSIKRRMLDPILR